MPDLERPGVEETLTHLEAKELIRRCAATRCDDSWSELMRRWETALRHAVRRTVHKAGGALADDLEDDLLQEVYCRLLEGDGRRLRLCRESDERGIVGYLCRLAENVVRDHARRQRASKRGLELQVGGEDAAAWIDRAADPAAASDRRTAIAESRSAYFERGDRALPGANRRRDLEITWLAVFEGWSSREIAERCRRPLSATNVDSIVHRTRSRLAAAEVDLGVRRGGGPPLG